MFLMFCSTHRFAFYIGYKHNLYVRIFRPAWDMNTIIIVRINVVGTITLMLI